MARFALVKDGRIVNFIAAEPGWKHPDGDLISDDRLTPAYARSQGVPIAGSDEDVLTAWRENGPVAAGDLNEHCVHDLLTYRDDLPAGLILPTSGSTGARKLAVTPWSGMDARADTWLTMMGGVTGPVWFVAPWESAIAWSTMRFASLRASVVCFYGLAQPERDPALIVGLPGHLVWALEKGFAPEKSALISMGRLRTDAESAVLFESGRRILDYYGSTETGVIAMTRYRRGADGLVSAATDFGDVEKVVIGDRGTVEVPSGRLATGYLDGPLPLRKGRYDTGDLAEIGPDGGLRILGRAS